MFEAAMKALHTVWQRNQDATLIAAVPVLLLGLGWCVQRLLTKAPKAEKTALINSQLDAIGKAKALGLTQEQVEAIARQIEWRGGHVTIVKHDGEQVVISKSQTEKSMPDGYWSNWAMKMRAGAELKVAEARLDQVLMEFETYYGDHHKEFIDAQRAWVAMKDAQVKLAFNEFKGGTHAGLAAAIEAILLTDKRVEELRRKFDELISR